MNMIIVYHWYHTQILIPICLVHVIKERAQSVASSTNKKIKNKIKIKKTMHSPETKCMPITQVGQGRGNKRFLSGKQI
jgi:hypothetical protein